MRFRSRRLATTAFELALWWSLAAVAGEAGPTPGSVTEVIPIKYASAAELVAVLGGSLDRKDSAETGWQPERLQRTTDVAGLRTELQSLGPRKIISDERSNSLLVSASAADLNKLRNVVARLDLALGQVLIEAVVLEAAAPRPRFIGPADLTEPLPSFKALTNAATVATSWYISSTTLARPSSSKPLLADMATLGGDLDSLVWALAGSSVVKVLQRPRIQTSMGVPATIVIGVGGPPQAYRYDGACGCQPAIQSVQTGVTLEVTCYLAADGAVLMDLHQQIDKLAGIVTIQNVGDVPVTTNYTGQAHVAVPDHGIVMLGGFILMSRDPVFSRVSFLDRVPIVGDWLNEAITYPKRKTRQELVVFLRPVLLPPPEITASRLFSLPQAL